MAHHEWQRVRFPDAVRCAYGHEFQCGDWAWFGRKPFVVCESCAAKYGIVRPVTEKSEGDDAER